jgi:hypothetical protein
LSGFVVLLCLFGLVCFVWFHCIAVSVWIGLLCLVSLYCCVCLDWFALSGFVVLLCLLGLVSHMVTFRLLLSQSHPSFLFYDLTTVTRQVPPVNQKLFTHPDHLSLPRVFDG